MVGRNDRKAYDKILLLFSKEIDREEQGSIFHQVYKVSLMWRYHFIIFIVLHDNDDGSGTPMWWP